MAVIPQLRPAYDRIDRADEHIEAIKVLMRAYLAAQPDRLIGEYDENVGVRLKGNLELPPIRIFTQTGECLHNLRSAWDHLAWQLVELNDGIPDDNTAMPVLRTRPSANKKTGVHPYPHIAGGVSKRALAAVDAVQPYQWASPLQHPLWVLHDLARIDRHRQVVLDEVVLDTISITGDEHLHRVTGRWLPHRVGDDYVEMILLPDDPNVDLQGKATLRITVSKPEPGLKAPLVETLVWLSKFTRQKIQVFENRIFSLH